MFIVHAFNLFQFTIYFYRILIINIYVFNFNFGISMYYYCYCYCIDMSNHLTLNNRKNYFN